MPAVRERLEELRSGGLERSSRDAEAIPLIDTGTSLAAPAGDGLLPVLISPVVDGRFGETAVLGDPRAGPHRRDDRRAAAGWEPAAGRMPSGGPRPAGRRASRRPPGRALQRR